MKEETLTGDNVCAIDAVDKPFGLVIFGASGDLTSRKLIPSFFNLFRNSLLPDTFFVLGTARSELSDGDFRSQMREWAGKSEGESFDSRKWEDFSAHLFYLPIQYDRLDSYEGLSAAVTDLEKRTGSRGSRVFYLATPPDINDVIIANIGKAGLAGKDSPERIVVEKPFGTDLASAKRLNDLLLQYFSEDRIFRIDHYLGKETVQNILLFRFANSIFEPLWNRSHIDHVQITVSETIGVGHRAGYYERSGVLRDMFQNHMLQLLSLVAMEPPNVFTAGQVRDEKVKIFHAIRPLSIARIQDQIILGQYTKGTIDCREVPGYREEEGVSPDSRTPTYAACKIFIDNWRWEGVPFYLQTGKRLPKKVSWISIHFRQAPGRMFKDLPVNVLPNVLTFVIQPEEEIILRFQAKVPGSRVCIRDVDMRFSYKEHYVFLRLDAYERVLLDCFSGQQLLFVRQDDTEAAWRFLTPVLETLDSARHHRIPVHGYPAGTWGPKEAQDLLLRDGRSWKVA
ncbi:MAG: glucose-6-phosphate dehydrogenase [bacterium]